MIAKHDAVGTGREELLRDFFRHAEAARRILAIDNNKVGREPLADFRQTFNNDIATRPSHHVAQIQDFHVSFLIFVS